MGKLVDLAISEEEKEKYDLSLSIDYLIDKWGIDWVCRNRELPQNFIEEWIEKIHIRKLLESHYLSEEILLKFRDLIHYKLCSDLKNHIFLEISGSELRSFLKKIIRKMREENFRDGRLKYYITFSGLIGEDLYEKHLKNNKIKIRTSTAYKQVEIETAFTKKFKNNCIRIYFNVNKDKKLQQEIYIV